MHARSATIHADPQRIDDGIRYVGDELMPVVVSQDGCIGLSMLCDRGSGSCIVTSSWGSRSAMHATTDPLRARLRRAAEAMGGDDPGVEDWEIAVMHRASVAGDGSCARVTWTRADPAVLAAALEDLPLTLLPRVDATEGFCSLSLFVDRGTGSGAATAVYRDRRTLVASRDHIRTLRQAMAEHMGMEVTGVAEFELALHHLRVPEVP